MAKRRRRSREELENIRNRTGIAGREFSQFPPVGLPKVAQAELEMHVVTHCEAPMYQASGHSLMLMRRLQGMEAGPSDTLWVGLSEIDPGGRATSSASDVEEIYICLAGEIQSAVTQGDNTPATVLRT